MPIQAGRMLSGCFYQTGKDSRLINAPRGCAEMQMGICRAKARPASRAKTRRSES